MLGDTEVTIQYGKIYQDEGYILKKKDKDISKEVTVVDNIDYTKLGQYVIKYIYTIGEETKMVERIVNIVDSEAPVISLNGSVEITLELGDFYKDPGIVAVDNYDGDISSKVKSITDIDVNKLGKYQVTYIVSDTSGNKAKTSRLVNVVDLTSEDENNLDNAVIKYIEEKHLNVSVGYYNLKTKNDILYNEDKLYYGASLIKTLDVLYYYETGMLNENNWQDIKAAIEVSSNLAHANLIASAGISAIQEYGKELGADYTLVGGDTFGNTTVRDQLLYLKKLYKIIQENSYVKELFINDYGNYLKINNLEVLHKYGYYGTFYHDVGIFMDEEPYILVVLSKHANNREIITEISKLVYDYHIMQKSLNNA